MQTPLQIVFDGLERSEALENSIREHMGKLEQFSERIISCRVSIEAEHRHHHRGRLHHVRIALHVPKKELVVNHDQHDKQAHEDPFVAVRDAFSSMTRQLEDQERIDRGDIKKHAD